MLLCNHYLMPQTLHEALSVWAEAPEGSRLVAGGTDLLPWAREGRAGDVKVSQLIDLSRVRELSGYSVCDGALKFGANLPFQSFLNDETLRQQAPCMPYCAIWFADDQIREQATLVGNLVNASPAADGTPAILAMNGEVEIARLEGGDIIVRNQALSDFVQGPGRTTLQDQEIITAVTCEALSGYGGAFEKVGQRRSLVISTVCTACLVKPSDDHEVFEDVRLAMGGIGPVPLRLEAIERFLCGKPIGIETIEEASRMSDGLVRSRTRQEYRRYVVEGFIDRALRNALSDCGVKLSTDIVKGAAYA